MTATATMMIATASRIMTMTTIRTMTVTTIRTATVATIRTATAIVISTRRVGARARKRDGGIAICLPARQKNRAVTEIEITTGTITKFITETVIMTAMTIEGMLQPAQPRLL